MADLSFAAFVEFLVSTFAIESVDVDPSANLRNDLGFDSIEVFELLVIIEDLTGVPLYGEAVATVATVADAFQYWSRR